MSADVTEAEIHETLLRYAGHGEIDELKVLLALTQNPGKFIDRRSSVSGRALIHEACANGHKDIVKYLLHETSCDVTRKTFLGRATALHLAASQGHRSIVFQLLSHGANPTSQDRFGNTPLHLATTKNCAKRIVEYGGEVMVFNKWRKDSYQVARDRDPDNKMLLKYLEEIGHMEYLKMQKELKEAKLRKKRDSMIAFKQKIMTSY